MASHTYSIRLNDTETKLLEAFQTSEDKTLNQTVVRLVREAIGVNSVNNAVYSVNSVNNAVNIKRIGKRRGREGCKCDRILSTINKRKCDRTFLDRIFIVVNFNFN